MHQHPFARSRLGRGEFVVGQRWKVKEVGEEGGNRGKLYREKEAGGQTRP